MMARLARHDTDYQIVFSKHLATKRYRLNQRKDSLLHTQLNLRPSLNYNLHPLYSKFADVKKYAIRIKNGTCGAYTGDLSMNQKSNSNREEINKNVKYFSAAAAKFMN